ncbi:MAG: hypothetical protein CBE01_005275 [Planctomycetaceae bacterium TMED241]|jgi:hypothetical protein|uniref:hypothetical protein n=1 Tax=Synechococcales TaxID=1890424 RepID=UPI0000333E7C|nr:MULTISPECIES: hypothetical protein [unclassified Synechococcus]MBL6740375.1 hypothetical protein [Synechococcus sp. BS301-5m-G54]MBL6796753.1 hypothetical protein [Synechococcus sp. BS307-5m-G34]OUW66309.1 MAG: hypothetical protein CBD65_05765 [Synechococcus sp. TMED205]RCL52710.1 MAG: hypothetical protein DBW84_07920 [Synechococcus sp. MED-G70]RPG08995.1 MAG: hypothetical protein CBE01_005275 [Planctomycetaceae bacterium TMED241]HCX54200.1 hypothetical protein [Synechococcus sp. UBA9887]|tara:strand:- start:1037 stop:1267 length:231 start_codon:yes stop_codon:yes gene_type:complete
MTANAAALYERIRSNPDQTQALFRQALQDPTGAMDCICRLGDDLGLPVTPDEVKAHLASLDDADTSRWLIKARGGL